MSYRTDFWRDSRTITRKFNCSCSPLWLTYSRNVPMTLRTRSASLLAHLPKDTPPVSKKSNKSKDGASTDATASSGSTDSQATVIPSKENLIGDLLSMDIDAPSTPEAATAASNTVYLLGGGLDLLLRGGTDGFPQQHEKQYLGDIFGLGEVTTLGYIAPKTVSLPSDKGKILEISGQMQRKRAHG